MGYRFISIFCVLFSSSAFLSAGWAAEKVTDFTLLPIANIRTSQDVLLSADGGTAVVAVMAGSDIAQMRWTAAEGVQKLDGAGQAATGISNDGTVVVGTRVEARADVDVYRWTKAGGAHIIPDLKGQWVFVSGDGRSLLAVPEDSAEQPLLRWSESGGVERVPLPRKAPNGSALGTFRVIAASADLSTVLMDMGDMPDNQRGQLWRWRIPDQLQIVTDYPVKKYLESRMSADGSVVVGVYSRGIRRQPFRWTEAEGLREWGTPRTNEYISNGDEPARMSGDGKVVVGRPPEAAGRSDKIAAWDGQGQRVLTASCACDVNIKAISADGSIVAGYIAVKTPARPGGDTATARAFVSPLSKLPEGLSRAMP